MKKLDEMIRDALEEADSEIYDQTKELGWFSQSLGLFSGKNAWVIWVIMIVQTVMFIAGVWCSIRFFQAVEVLPALKWGISGAVLWIMAINLKLSLVPQIQAERILRELKRVELMLARGKS